VVVLAILLSLMALIQANHRAAKGRSALLKWEPTFVALEAGEPIYQVGSEGYPTLPLSLLVMSPFRAAGPRAGALLWAAFKIGLAWWIVWTALTLAASHPRDFPTAGLWIVLLLSFRVLLSDVLHGNTNIVIGATIVAAAQAWRRGQDARAGLWIGLGAVLKVTPLLGLLYFVRKRSGQAVAGTFVALAAGTLLLPALWLGWSETLELTTQWSNQMLTPYLQGREIGLTQSEHINQSLFGVLARLLTASVAIPANPPEVPADVYVNWASLPPAAFRWVHVGVGALVLVLVGFWCRRAVTRTGPVVLGEFSALWLAMVLLSERSWKHHFVLLALPVGYLAWYALRGAPGSRRRLAFAALATAAVCIGLSGTAVLSDHASNLAEAYGAYLIGALALFAATGLCLMGPDHEAQSPAE